MRLRVLTVSGNPPAWINSGWAEYAKRLPKHLQLELIAIPPVVRRNDADILHAQQQEGDKLLQRSKDCYRIVMDGNGQRWNTRQLASKLSRWQSAGRDCAFLIGGADGHSQHVLQQADVLWSLGDLTYPHHLVRVILAEQLYRAYTITINHPYHRG